MINNSSGWIRKKSTGRIVIVCLLIMLLFMIFVLPDQVEKSIQSTGSSKSPDTSFFYTPAEIYQLADEYGPEGRQAYILNRWTFDLIFPLVYVGFLTTGISWFFKDFQDGKWIFLNLVPIFAGIFDYLENITASIVMARYPNRLAIIAYLSSGFTFIKWLFVYGSFLIYFLGLFLYLISQYKQKRKS